MMKKLFHKAFDKIVKFSQQDDLGHVLNVTGTIGWAASSAAFTGAVALNENIPREQKKFLIPQEIADGVVNCTLFWTCTRIANNKAKQWVKEGKIFPVAIKKEVQEVRKKLGSGANLSNIQEKLSPQASKRLNGFKSSFPALVSVGGSILAANIITPFIRNYIASKMQKHDFKKDKNTIKYTQAAPNKAKAINYSGLSMEQYLMSSRNSNMRI